jgi:hypothetical protein
MQRVYYTVKLSRMEILWSILILDGFELRMPLDSEIPLGKVRL